MSTTLWIVLIVGFLIIYGIIKSKMRTRRIVEDFEADLHPTMQNEFSQKGKGEIERELYDDGSSELKVQFSRTTIPDGSTVTLLINGTKTGDFEVSKGRVYKKIDSLSGLNIPNIKSGDKAEVEYNGIVVLSGTFYPD